MSRSELVPVGNASHDSTMWQVGLGPIGGRSADASGTFSSLPCPRNRVSHTAGCHSIGLESSLAHQMVR